MRRIRGRGKYGKVRVSPTKTVNLHTYVWNKYRGKVPRGFIIHHKDGNKSNNSISNLAIIKRKNHDKLHFRRY